MLLSLTYTTFESDMRFILVFADRRATARTTTFVEPCNAFMENCAKRWQTKEGTYQLKRRRLLPDVRDPIEYPGADIDMADI